MQNIITGHEADIQAINADAADWEKDIASQLRHIAATATDQLAQYAPGAVDVFGDPLAGTEHVSDYALQAIEACIARIRALQQ